MKKKSLLFSVLCMMCVALVTGCGEDKYEIKATSNNYEAGTISGGGNYVMNATVTLRVTANLGCNINSSTPLTFKNSSGDVDSTLNLNSSTDGTYTYQFVVNTQTIGEYTANFECITNSADSLQNTEVLKHKVKFVFDIEGSETDFEKEEEIADGNKVSSIDYIDGVDGKVDWYTAAGFSQVTKYNFDKAVTNSFTLYGKVAEVTNTDVVKEAVANFKNTSKLEIINTNGYKAEILDFDKGYDKMRFSLYSSNSSSAPINYKMTSIIQDNKYYIINLNNGTKSVFKIAKEGESGITFKDMYNHYSFVEIADLDVSNYAESEIVKGESKVDVEVGGKAINCDVYTLSKSGADTTIKLYIYKGKVYRVDKEVIIADDTNSNYSNSIVINYIDGEMAGSVLSDAKEGYLIKLYSNDEELNEGLEILNNDYSRVLRITPSFGQTVESVIKNYDGGVEGYSLRDSLAKAVAYTLTNYAGGICSEEPYANIGAIDSDVSVCVRVSATIKEVFEVLETLKSGNYKIELDSGAFSVLGSGYIKPFYEVAMGVDVLSSGVDLTGMNEKMLEGIEELRGIIKEDSNSYDSFQFDSKTNTYSFFKDEVDSVPFIKITLNTEGKISSVDYFDGENTYINTFTYNPAPIE